MTTTPRVTVRIDDNGNAVAETIGDVPECFDRWHEINYRGCAEVRYEIAENQERSAAAGSPYVTAADAEAVRAAADSLTLAAYWREMLRTRPELIG